MKTIRTLLLLALATVLPPTQAQTAKWPEKPVRVIVPFPPGGAIDIVARVVTPRLAEELGQSFVVENRPGAAGTIGSEQVARAAPDGYTLVVVGSSYASSAALYKLPYDPIKGIAPVSMLAAGPLILVVHPSVKASNLKEFLALARAQPGGLNFGSGGSGGTSHLTGELFKQMTQTDIVHVPYKGGAPAITDLLAGQIQVMFAPVLESMPHIKTGKLRDIAVTSEQRMASMPALPAIAESVPGYSSTFWFGMWAPPGTPREVVTRLNQALVPVLRHPAVLERFRADGVESAHSSPEDFARMLGSEIAKWSNVVRNGNIRAD